MRRTEQAQGLRLMKFEEVYGRSCRGVLGQAEAAEILGVSERTFRRWRDRFEADGAEGLYDRRLGRVSARRAPIDEVARVLELFDTRYWDFTAKHFHEKLVAKHGCGRSYNWVRLTLQAYGRRRAAPRRGAHRRKRPRRALPGMMVHQDGSRHGWLAGQPPLDLIVTMDDATSEIYSAFFVEEEGTMSSFRALSEVIGERGLFCSLYADRASHYWHTPDAGGKVDKDNPTQVGRALQRLGIELIAAYSPEARGRSERMFGTLQKRLPQELRLAGITGIDEANRFLKEVYLPQHNARFATPAEDQGTAFVPFAGALDDILCIHEDRTVANDNTVRYKRLALQIPADRHRRHYVKATVRVHEYPDGTLAVFHGPRCLARYKAGGTPSTPQPGRPRDPLRRDRPKQPQPKRSTHLVHKPVSSECSRQSLDRLKAAGLRPTRQRIALAKLLFECGDRHVTADATTPTSRKPASCATSRYTASHWTNFRRRPKGPRSRIDVIVRLRACAAKAS